MSNKRPADPSPEQPLTAAPRLDFFDCLVADAGASDCRCSYHQFIRNLSSVEELIVPFPMPESKRLYRLELGRKKQQQATSALRRIDSLPFSRNTSSDSIAVTRLSRFLELLSMFCSAPWCSAFHKPNHMMLQRLTYSHLPIIVGRDHMEAGQELLKNLITSDTTLSPGNQVWICNRQQGKTTTLGQFCATLLMLSVCNAEKTIFLYSTSLDRYTTARIHFAKTLTLGTDPLRCCRTSNA
jgi:hypothetical protein